MKTYIHIGYPKNASTSLQADFFPNIEGAYYLGCQYGKDLSYVTKEVQEAVTSIAMSDSIEFSYSEVEKRLHTAVAGMSRGFDKLILSSESFANNVADRGLIAERLNKLFPDANVLIIIRNQMDSLESMYAFLVQQLGKNINLSYGRPSIESYQRWIQEQEEFFHRSYLVTLKYHELITKYWALFGKEKVTVLLFEELVDSPNTFFKKIENFLEVENAPRPLGKRNSSPTTNQVAFYKLKAKYPGVSFSRYLPAFVANGVKKILLGTSGSRHKEELPIEMRERLENYYREGNRNLQHDLNINLANYGYVI